MPMDLKVFVFSTKINFQLVQKYIVCVILVSAVTMPLSVDLEILFIESLTLPEVSL